MCFLADSRRDTASDSEEPDARTSDVVQRLDFLNRHVRVTIGHWEGWDLATYPSVGCVELRGDMTKAYVSFSMFSLAGWTVMQRESGEWSIKESDIMGIE